MSVVEAVASNRGGSAIFFFCDAATDSGSLARDIPAGEARDFSASTHERNVRSVILDELAGDTEPVRARGLVLKIDVEGFEKEVLEGAAGLVGRAAWWRALLEFSPSCLRSANKDIAETWRLFRRYAGTVLDPASATEAVDLGMLPEEPPVGEVELLVVAGRLPAPCAHP